MTTLDSTIDSYLQDTSDQTLIPLYSIAYIYTFPMSLEDINYIHDDVHSYIYSQTSINSESIDIYLSLIFEILQKQKNSLNYDTINNYLQTFMTILNNSTSEITSDNIQTIFTITETILQFGNFSLNYIKLVDDFFNTIINLYSLNMMPGTVIANLQINDTFYYKTRLLSSNYSNFTLVFNDSTEITITDLQFDPNTIVNLIVSIYPQINGYSSILSINFTESGNYTNHTLYLNPEETLLLNSSIITVLIPYYKNVTDQWRCTSYNGNLWTEADCTVIGMQNLSILIEISMNSFFQLGDSSSLNHNPSKFPSVIIITSVLMFSLYICCAIAFIVKSSSHYENDENTNKMSNLRLIFRYHMLFWYITPSPRLKNLDRFIIHVCILNLTLAIEGALYYYNSISSNYQGEMILIGLIASICSIPLNIIPNIFMNSYEWHRYFFLLFYFTTCTACAILACFLSLAQSDDTNIKWIISFFWGILFDIILEFLISFILLLFIHNNVDTDETRYKKDSIRK